MRPMRSASTIPPLPDGVNIATFRWSLPAHPVDATPYNQLIWQYFQSRINLCERTPSEPKQGFCFVWADAREQNQPPRPLREDFEQVLQRPIETTPFMRTWPSKPRNPPIREAMGDSLYGTPIRCGCQCRACWKCSKDGSSRSSRWWIGFEQRPCFGGLVWLAGRLRFRGWWAENFW